MRGIREAHSIDGAEMHGREGTGNGDPWEILEKTGQGRQGRRSVQGVSRKSDRLVIWLDVGR